MDLNRTQKVRCAVIGAGWWGTTAHLPAIKSHPLAELVAVQSCEADRAARVAKHFGARFAFTSVSELLALPGLDAVIISSTANMHYSQAKAALERGCHVLVEKPMTMRAQEALDLVDLAQAQGRELIVSCPWHYTDHAVEARRLVSSGAIGTMKMISVLMTNFSLGLYRGVPWAEVLGAGHKAQEATKTYIAPRQSSYSDPSVAGGGQIYTQVSHPAALIAYLTGRQPVEVFARFDNHDTSVDVHNILSIKLNDGTLVSLASTGATMPSRRNFELRAYGTEGMIIMDLWDGTMEYHSREAPPRIYPKLASDKIYPLHAPALNLIGVAAGRAQNNSPGSLGLVAMHIIESACKSENEKRNVRTSENPEVMIDV